MRTKSLASLLLHQYKEDGNCCPLLTPSAAASCGEEYTKIFLPLMLHELWSSVSASYEEKVVGGREEIVPVCLQEMCKDPTQQFNLVEET